MATGSVGRSATMSASRAAIATTTPTSACIRVPVPSGPWSGQPPGANGTGLFFCWGVKYGLAEANRIEQSGQYGISIGHRDTDNLIVNNTVCRSGKVGVLFRIDGDKPFAPHRNRLLRNRIQDSGPDDGVAVDVQGEVEGLTISGNEIAETRGPQRRIGIRIGAKARDIQLADNRIRGCAVEVADLRKR